MLPNMLPKIVALVSHTSEVSNASEPAGEPLFLAETPSANDLAGMSSRKILKVNLSGVDLDDAPTRQALFSRATAEGLKAVLLQMPDFFADIYQVVSDRPEFHQVAKFLVAASDARVDSHYDVMEIMAAIDFIPMLPQLEPQPEPASGLTAADRLKGGLDLSVIDVIKDCLRSIARTGKEAEPGSLETKRAQRAVDCLALLTRELTFEPESNMDFWKARIQDLNGVPAKEASHIIQLRADAAELGISNQIKSLGTDFPIDASAIPKRVRSITVTVPLSSFAEEVRTFMNANNASVLGRAPQEAPYQGVALSYGDFIVYVESPKSSPADGADGDAELGSASAQKPESTPVIYDMERAQAFLNNSVGKDGDENPKQGGVSELEFQVQSMDHVNIFQQRFDAVKKQAQQEGSWKESKFGANSGENKALDRPFMRDVTADRKVSQFFPGSEALHVSFSAAKDDMQLKPGYVARREDNQDFMDEFSGQDARLSDAVLVQQYDEAMKTKTGHGSALNQSLPGTPEQLIEKLFGSAEACISQLFGECNDLQQAFQSDPKASMIQLMTSTTVEEALLEKAGGVQSKLDKWVPNKEALYSKIERMRLQYQWTAGKLFDPNKNGSSFTLDHLVTLAPDRRWFELMRLVYGFDLYRAIPGEHVLSPKTGFGTSVWRGMPTAIDGVAKNPYPTGPVFPGIWPQTIIKSSMKRTHPHVVIDAIADADIPEPGQPKTKTPLDVVQSLVPISKDNQTGKSVRQATLDDIATSSEKFEVTEGFADHLKALNDSESLPAKLKMDGCNLLPTTQESLRDSDDQTHQQMAHLFESILAQHAAIRCESQKGKQYETTVDTWRMNATAARIYREALQKKLFLLQKELAMPHVQGNEAYKALVNNAISQLQALNVRGVSVMPKPSPDYYKTLSEKFVNLARQSATTTVGAARAEAIINELIARAERTGTLLDLSFFEGEKGALQQVFTGGTLHAVSWFFELAARVCTDKDWVLLQELAAICGNFGTTNFEHLVIGLQAAIRRGRALRLLFQATQASNGERIYRLNANNQIVCDMFNEREHRFVTVPMGIPAGA